MKKINSNKPQSDMSCDKWMRKIQQKTLKYIIFYNTEDIKVYYILWHNSFPTSLHKALLKMNMTTLAVKINIGIVYILKELSIEIYSSRNMLKSYINLKTTSN